jgi:hypothetical protein
MAPLQYVYDAKMHHLLIVNYISVPITIQYGSNKPVFVCDFGGLGLSNGYVE